MTVPGVDKWAKSKAVGVWLNDDMLGRLRDRHGLYPGVDQAKGDRILQTRYPGAISGRQGMRFVFFDTNAARSRVVA